MDRERPYCYGHIAYGYLHTVCVLWQSSHTELVWANSNTEDALGLKQYAPQSVGSSLSVCTGQAKCFQLQVNVSCTYLHTYTSHLLTDELYICLTK